VDRRRGHRRADLGRLFFLLLSLVLFLVGFVIVVEVRCLLGWVNPEECHAWD
jgi:hypothetical protein